MKCELCKKEFNELTGYEIPLQDYQESLVDCCIVCYDKKLAYLSSIVMEEFSPVKIRYNNDDRILALIKLERYSIA